MSQNIQSEDKKVVSITEAAKLNKVTRQAIYVAIKLNKLKATKETTRWTISLEDLEAYRRQKYSRTKSVYNGELLFDNNKGYFSVRSPITNKLHVRTYHHLHADNHYASIFMAVRDVLIDTNIIER